MKDISNSQLTLVRKLNRKKYREQEQLFLIEGSRAVEQIISNGIVEVSALFFDESQSYWIDKPWSEIITNYSSAKINKEHFEDVTDTDNPQGVLAVCRIPTETGLEDFADQSGVLLATDRIQDPGNLGTMVRTAAWFGAKGLLCGKGTVDLFHPKVVRSTAGATGTLNYRNAELHSLLPKMESLGWRVLILEGGQDAADLRTIKASGKTILLVGNEANGVDPALFVEQRKSIRIAAAAGQKKVESLNAAIAAGIALFALTK